MKKDFSFLQKKAYFSTGIIRSLAENRFWKGKKIVFYEEQNTGYFSLDLSQFHIFWRKLTVLRGGALNFQDGGNSTAWLTLLPPVDIIQTVFPSKLLIILSNLDDSVRILL